MIDEARTLFAQVTRIYRDWWVDAELRSRADSGSRAESLVTGQTGHLVRTGTWPIYFITLIHSFL